MFHLKMDFKEIFNYFSFARLIAVAVQLLFALGTAFMHIKTWHLLFWRKIILKSPVVYVTTFGTIQSFFFWFFLLGGPLNWTMLKYINVPRKCRKPVVDTNTGNKSGRCGGGTSATLTMLRPAMAATLM